MTDPRSQPGAPNLAPQVLKRLGYHPVGGARPWWRRDRAVIPALIAAGGGVILAMAVLAVVQFQEASEPSAIRTDAGVLNEALGRAAALGDLEEAFLRVRLPENEGDVSSEMVVPAGELHEDSTPEFAPSVPLVPIFIPPATSDEVDGYERVVASGPDRST
ncbi:MAG: hypothetical protein MK085_07735 [Phycisphaerales bacterium]|nr:hypothetical protein [Phycisphaerales bacterium]